jgi:hypothetical protein
MPTGRAMNATPKRKANKDNARIADKKATPSKSKVKITGKASTSAGGSKSIKPGAMSGNTKIVLSNQTAKKTLKRPTGELSKSNSGLAKFIKGHGMAKGFTAAEARTAAGKYRDMKKAAGPKGFGGLDASGNALGRAMNKTRKMRKGR